MSNPSSKTLADERVREWLILEQARKERLQALEKKTNPVITLSRQAGSCGDEIAEEVVRQLGAPWQLWDKQLIDAIAEHASVRSHLVEAVEHHHSEFTQVVESMLGIRTFNEADYRLHLAEVLFSLGHSGCQLIVGRGANFLLKKALNVCVKASFNFRLKNYAKEHDLTDRKATDALHQADKERTEFIRNLFGLDPDNDAYYDMTLYTDQLGVQGAAGSIISAANAMYGLSLK